MKNAESFCCIPESGGWGQSKIRRLWLRELQFGSSTFTQSWFIAFTDLRLRHAPLDQERPPPID